MLYLICYRFYSSPNATTEWTTSIGISLALATKVCAVARLPEYQAQMPHDVWMVPA
jgi:hypothetical protein